MIVIHHMNVDQLNSLDMVFAIEDQDGNPIVPDWILGAWGTYNEMLTQPLDLKGLLIREVITQGDSSGKC